MRYIILALLVLAVSVCYSVVVPVIVVNTTNCSTYFPNITNNTVYYLLNGTYNSTECIQLNLTNKVNVTLIGQSKTGVDLYNLSNGYTLQVLNSKQITFKNLSISEPTNYIYINNSETTFNNCNIYINKTTIGYSMFYAVQNNILNILNSLLQTRYLYQNIVEFKSSNNTILINNSKLNSNYYTRVTYAVTFNNNFVYINNTNISFLKGCYISCQYIYINNSSIVSTGLYSNLVLMSKTLYLLNSLLYYQNTLYIASNLSYIKNNTFIATNPNSFAFDNIVSNYTYFYDNKYFNNKTCIIMNGKLLYLFNNTFWFNVAFSYIINTLNSQFYIFTPAIYYNITIARNNSVNGNLHISTCGSNSKFYELILDNCTSYNTTDYFVVSNQNSTSSLLNDSNVLLLIFSNYTTNFTLNNDNFTFLYSKLSNAKVLNSVFRTIYANKVNIQNSKTRLSNVSYNIYIASKTSFKPTTIALNSSSAIVCNQIYANKYYNTLINNSFNIIENNTINYVYNSKLCVPSSFKILYGDKVYVYYSWLNNYTVDASLVILNNTSNIWLPSLPDEDYYCNGTKMYIEPVKHVKKKKKKYCNVHYVDKTIYLVDKRKTKTRNILLILDILAMIIVIFRLMRI